MGILVGKLTYKKGGKESSVSLAKSFESKDLSITASQAPYCGGTRFTAVLTPKSELEITACTVFTDEGLSKESKLFLNGYQTWTDSKEVTLEYSVPKLNFLAKPLIGMYGDYGFFRHSRSKLHSYTYTYIKNSGDAVTLYGSLSEKFGYTLFEYDKVKSCLTVLKDCSGLCPKVGEPYVLFDLYIINAEESAAFDGYFSAQNVEKPKVKPCTGWTSWYNYYTKVTQNDVLENLESFSSRELPIDYFQIDDGFQQAVGDWLSINNKFPRGMGYLADEIHSAGYKAGLWLAPIICEKTSQIYRDHPDWVLCKAGFNPGWSGVFYALDFYNPEVRAYLREVFDTVLNKWNFDMVKLDFLYAACLKPPKDKTRGQVMCEFFEFLRDISGDKIILGCGAPLGCAFGLFDYCRISSDVALMWEDKALSALNYRERVSTVNALTSTIGRFNLNGRAFLNDPDVFILRNSNNKLTDDQKYTLFMINSVLGGLVFTSDNINEYSERQMELFKTLFKRESVEVKSITAADTVTVRYNEGEKELCLLSNLSVKKAFATVPFNSLTQSENRFLAKDELIELRPCQTVCLRSSDSQ
ncbi:MAG: alpha-galactosidase [Clostridia bacterium]|nr:alpha-galactosidase [Clostridia bacterium]